MALYTLESCGELGPHPAASGSVLAQGSRLAVLEGLSGHLDPSSSQAADPFSCLSAPRERNPDRLIGLRLLDRGDQPGLRSLLGPSRILVTWTEDTAARPSRRNRPGDRRDRGDKGRASPSPSQGPSETSLSGHCLHRSQQQKTSPQSRARRPCHLAWLPAGRQEGNGLPRAARGPLSCRKNGRGGGLLF